MEKFTILKNETFNVGGIQKQRIIIKDKQNKPMKPKEVKKIVQLLNKKYIDTKKKDPKILVRGMDTLGQMTLKGYDEPIDDMFEDVEDYLNGRVKANTKYLDFTQVEISMFS